MDSALAVSPVGTFYQQDREEIKEKTMDSLFDNSLKDNDEGMWSEKPTGKCYNECKYISANY